MGKMYPNLFIRNICIVFLVIIYSLMQPSVTAKRSKNVSSIKKPATITMIADSGIISEQSGLTQFLEEFKKETGIELRVIKPNHNEYRTKVKIAFMSGQTPDVVQLDSSNYVYYAQKGVLVDLSGMISRSQTFLQMDSVYINQIKINGKIYGNPISEGNGLITYIRKDWLDKLGLKVPTDYESFIDVMRAFKSMGEKEGEDIIPCTAPGLESNGFPDYLKEFYQNATPDFELKDGTWVDGMLQPEMKKALVRLRDAYNEGLIDKDVLTNTSTTCREKFTAGNVGVFNYWAGAWMPALENELQLHVKSGKLIAIPPIENVSYVQGLPSVYAITKKAQNPEGIFKYFFEYMHDGKKGTLLFSHGVNGLHYKINHNGVYTVLANPAHPSSRYERTIIELGMNLEPNYKDPIPVDSRVIESEKILHEYSRRSILEPTSDVYAQKRACLQTIRSDLVARVVIDNMDVDTAVASYRAQTSGLVDWILKDFNAG